MENLLAKALFDNTAECPDELPFRKGDIVTVMDQNVAGSRGWWRCSLHGRQGLAPANRLHLLSPSQCERLTHSSPTLMSRSCSPHNIYQIPSVPRQPPGPAYEPMDRIYKVPLMPHRSPGPLLRKQHSESEFTCSKVAGMTSPEVYDVPAAPKQASLYSPSTQLGLMRKYSQTLKSEAKQKYSLTDNRTNDPSYDVPVPLATEAQQRLKSTYSTLPNPNKSDWIYDVPVTPEKPSVEAKGPSDKGCKIESRSDSLQQLYDIPKPSTSPKQQDEPQGEEQQNSVYDVPPRLRRPEEQAGDGVPKPMREVTLTQDEAGRRLLELQDDVCQAVPRLMAFVSSGWRSRYHLKPHLGEIRAAAENITVKMSRFLGFALDVRGNAERLSDTQLQVRLQKQLSIVEDSGLILQQAGLELNADGWRLDVLAQDDKLSGPGLDQLDRFVMVARTVPEDIRRLVSILNANGKLLFRQAQTESGNSQSEMGKTDGDSGEDNDYVQLQTKTEFEKQQRMVEESKLKQGSPKPPPPSAPPQQRTLSEHCRLYFGALQKAIGVLVGSLLEGQPPEKFISHSKLVIMVGQKLVDTLCREAPLPDVLVRSSHLCALLKQLAVAIKKAALHFPEQDALQEAQDFAKELAQRTQHFRNSMDLSLASRA